MKETKFKETEIGKIPKDWNINTLREITFKITKGTTPTTLKKQFVDKGINFIKVESLTESGDFIPSKFAHIDEETNQLLKRSIIEEHDVLFSIAGVIGRTTIATKEILPANTNQAIAIVRPNTKKVVPMFLRYILTNKVFLYGAQSNIVQTAQPNLSLGLLSNAFLSIPPIQEQKAISDILSKLDEKIKLSNKMNKSLEAMGKTFFKKWFVDIKEIPKGWEIKSLSEVADYLNGLALQKYPPKGGGDLPVIKIRELKNGITENTDKANSELPQNYILKDGDILFSWSGSLEVVLWGNGKGALNQHLFKVTSEEYSKWFYYYWTLNHLQEFRMIAEGKATTMGHIKRHHLDDAKCLVPDKKTLEKMSKVMKPLIEMQLKNLIEKRKLTQIRDTLLPKLMSGRIRVK